MPKALCIILAFVLTLTLPLNINSPSLYAKEALDLEAVLDEMDAANLGLKTMMAEVTYTRTIFLLDEEEVSEGTLRYKKPRKLRLEFEPPNEEVDVSDGDFFWVYKPKERQVEKYKLAEGETTELNFFEFGYEGSVGKAKENYFIEIISADDAGESEGKNEGIYILKLIPKPSATQMPQYNEIRLWVDDSIWLPVRMELYESEGEVINRIELWEIKINESLD
ncbi:MAG: outer membrane lipoprotein carrier protein LolA, partial [Candidatus Brocadiales bacterium]